MATVRDSDRGFRRRVEGMKKADGEVVITVGVHAEDASSEVLTAANANEFGTDTIPARPSITAYADENQAECVRRMRDAVAAAVKANAPPSQYLDALAQRFAGEIQQKVADGIPPENAPATLARKNGTTPLINTGQFRSSIAGKVSK